MARAKMTGLAKVVANLNRAVQKIEGRTEEGLTTAVKMVKYKIDTEPPVVPVGDTGNLAARWRSEIGHTSEGPFIEFGHEVDYAAKVHEMVDTANHAVKWNRPGSGPKWLEIALDRNRKEILGIIAGKMRIRG